MIPRRLLAGTLGVLAAAAVPAAAQNTIAQRVARAPDGVVHMQFAGHDGVCGDGRDVIGYKKAFFARNMQSFGRWSAQNCVPGPVRVALSVAGGRVTQMETFVGGTWARTTAR